MVKNNLLKHHGIKESANGLVRRTLTGSGGYRFNDSSNNTNGSLAREIGLIGPSGIDDLNTPSTVWRRNSIDERIHYTRTSSNRLNTSSESNTQLNKQLNGNIEIDDDTDHTNNNSSSSNQIIIDKNNNEKEQDDKNTDKILLKHYFPIPEEESIEGEKYQQFTKDILDLKELTMPEKTGMYVYAHHLTYRVKDLDNRKSSKNLLSDLSFYLKPKEMTLILGSPGCGKSTLFKVLANHISNKRKSMSGRLLFNGHPINERNHHRDVGYVPQEDNHFPLLTVKETLRFALDCQGREGITDEEKEYRVDHTLHTLGLWEQRDTLVGNEFIRGISGGQKKRVTIGVTAIRGSNLLLMDEITNGLDSTTSLEVIGCIRKVVTHTLSPALITLLQPSAQITSLFDNLIILSKGSIVYFGPVSKALDYFEDLGFICPNHYNPSEFFQEIVDDPQRYSFIHPPKCQTTDDFIQAYHQSKIYHDLMETMDNTPTGIISDVPVNHLIDNSKSKGYTQPLYKQIEYCTKRGLKLTYRNISASVTRVIKGALMGIILGTLFWRLDHNQGGGNSRFGLMYFATTYILVGTFANIGPFFIQRKIFSIQKKQRYYGTLSFFISSIICDLPGSILEILIFNTLIYWLCNLRPTAERYLFTLFLLFFVDLMNLGIIKTFCSISNSSEMANIYSSILVGLFLLVSGFMVPRQNIKGWWIWLYYISPYNWAYQGLIINEFAGQPYYCRPSEMVPPLGYPLLNVTYDHGGYNGVQTCAHTKGEQFIDQYGMHTSNSFKYDCILIVAAMALLFNTLAYICLGYFSYTPKPKSMVVKSKRSKTVDQPQQLNQQQHLQQQQQIQQNNNKSVISETIEMDIYNSNIQHNELINNNINNEISLDNMIKSNGCYLEFKNLSYEIDIKSNKKKSKLKLIDNIDGYAKPGSMLAIMGPSGAGKSTLLDILAGRKSTGYITGEILFNGKPRTKYFHRMASYVEQQDILCATQTVGEAIWFSAECRLPHTMDREMKNEFIEKIIQVLNLKKIQHFKIGELGNGISLSQRKLVNIGIELASNPELLFLDEPTSGLDSGSAFKVMQVISRIAKSMNRTVICTIHQPSAAIFEQFDRLLLLYHGQIMYFGELGHQSEAIIEYLAQQGRYMKPHYNPADFLMEIPHDVQEQSITFYQQSKEYHHCKAELASGIVPTDHTEIQYDRLYASSTTHQLKVLFKRAMRSKVRMTSVYLSNWLRSVLLAIVLGTLFIRMKYEPIDARNRVSLVFFSIQFLVITSIGSIPTAFKERAVFYREKDAGFYRVSCYLITYITTSYPFLFATSTLFAVPLYFLTNLDTHPISKFFYYCFIMFITGIVFDAFAYLSAVFFPNEAVATSICGALLSLSALFAGFMNTRPNMPAGWKWMNDLSMIKYLMEMIVTNEFQNEHFHCPDNDGAIPIPVSANQTRFYCPIQDGELFIQHVYEFKLSRRYLNLSIIFGYLLAIYLASYIILKKIKWQIR